jgi:inhibitor of cysteine peptidase
LVEFQALKEDAMKRVLFLVVAVVLTLGLAAGCGGVKTYSDEGQTIDVGVGQEFIIELDSNPTTGYSWQADYDTTRLELVGGEPTYTPDETEEPAMGSGGVESFRFKALQAGDTQVSLTYAQPWEGGGVGETQVFTVNID